jgi:predicted enzyme related to lactoylglutathione lyase
MQNAINWFEIPVENMDRAVRCYETLLGEPLRRETMGGGMPYAILPHVAPGSGGALAGDPARPRGQGVMIYLNANGKLDAILARVEAANAKVILPKMQIGKDGFIAIIADTEGNHIGFNSEN